MKPLRFVMPWICVALLVPNLLHALPPRLTSATYFFPDQLMVLGFDQEIDPASLDTDGFYVSVGPDYAQNTHQLQLVGSAINVEGGTVSITLSAVGVNGEYEVETDFGVYETRYTWGQLYASARFMELHGNTASFRFFLLENTVRNSLGEGNFATGPSNGQPLTTAGWIDAGPELLDATIDDIRGIITFQFDQPVQYDLINEDLSVDGEPGDSSMQAYEDRNHNGNLDFEQNIFVPQISIVDQAGGIHVLHAQSGLERVGTSTFVDDYVMDLNLTMVDRIALDGMNLSQANVSMGRWAFTGQDYKGNRPATVPLDVETILDPIEIQGVTYDAGLNELTIRTDSYCSLDGPMPVQFGRIHFTNPGGADVTLSGSDRVRLSSDNHDVRLDVPIYDQFRVEEVINASGGNPGVIIDTYAIYGQLGERNERAVQPLFVVPETEGHHGPVAESAVYNQTLNQFAIDYDLRIGASLNHPDGFTISVGNVTNRVVVQSIERINSNRTLLLNLTPESAIETEQFLGMGEGTLHIASFTVLEHSEENGSPQADLVVTVEGADSPPVPLTIFYFYHSDRIQIQFSETVRVSDVQGTGIRYAGVDLVMTNPELVAPDILMMDLSDATITQLANLPLNQRMNPVVSIAADVVHSSGGIGNEAFSNLTHGTDLSEMGGSEYLLLGMANRIRIPNYENYQQEPEDVDLLLRRSGIHCRLFVEVDQLVAYEENNGHTPMTETDIDFVYNLIETSTPESPSEGAFSSLTSLFALGHESDIPTRCDVFIVDLKDEAGKGRNDSDQDFFVPYTFLPAIEGSSERLFLDCHPQTFGTLDRAYTKDLGSDSWLSWDTRSGDNAVIGLLTRWMLWHLDQDEEPWVVNGISSLAERLVTGEASFYGEELPNRVRPGICLTTTYTDNTHLENRQDLMFQYYFFEYLYEKYGGEDLLDYLSTEPTDGIEGVVTSINHIRSVNPLEEPFQSRSFEGLFLDFAIAGTVDDGNGGAEDPHEFAAFSMNYGSAETLLNWRENSPPPYRAEVPPYSIHRWYTAYGPYYPNTLLDPNGSFYLDGQDERQWAMATVRCENGINTASPGEFLVEEIDLDRLNSGEVELTIPGWQFGGDSEADYSTNVVVVVSFAEETDSPPCRVVLNNNEDYFFPPAATATPASESSIRINIDLPWGELGFSTQFENLSPRETQKRIHGNKAAWAASLMGESKSDNEGGLAGFTIHRLLSPDDPDPAVVVNHLQSLSFVDTGLETGRTYYYEIFANYFDPEGSSAPALTSAQTHIPGKTAKFQMTVTNIGIYGDPMYSSPSMEYPIGSGIYNTWECGFMVGAKRGGVPYVSRSQFGELEWAPEEDYSPRAVVLGGDLLRYETSFHDENSEVNDDPMGLSVQQQVFTWPEMDNPDLARVMVIRVDVQNTGFTPLEEVYIGWLIDGDIGAGPGGDITSPHLDDMMGVDRDRDLGYMYDADDPTTPGDDTGEYGLAPGYLGARMMSSPATHLGWWDWAMDPADDYEMYALLDGSSEMYEPIGRMLSPEEAGYEPFDYRIFASVGPYTLEGGETRFAEIAVMICDDLQQLQDVADLIFGLIGDVPGQGEPLPVKFSIGDAYPNPFNGTTSMTITLPQQGRVGFELFDVLGRSVYRDQRVWQAGMNRWHLAAPSATLGSGVYLLRIDYQQQSETRKIVHIK